MFNIRHQCKAVLATVLLTSASLHAGAEEKQDTHQAKQDTNQTKQDTNQTKQDANQTKQDTKIEKPSSPWLLTPTISSDPKMGNSIGFMGAYLKRFDKASPASMFGVVGTYSDSKSKVYGGFTRSYWGEDKHRLLAGAFGGEINNEYNDYLGSGWPVNTKDDLQAFVVRYTYNVVADWRFGGKFISSNYAISGTDELSDSILDILGLTGFQSNGAGLVAERDTRDNQNSPTSGSWFVVDNTIYRKDFGGQQDFDVYNGKYLSFYPNLGRHVLGVRLEGRWTHNAPASAYSTVNLRGYTRGQYLGKHATTLELEERFKLSERWGLNVFAGVSSLYGESNTQWYGAMGAGVNYMIKPKERMVVRADVAKPESQGPAFYLQFGQAF